MKLTVVGCSGSMAGPDSPASAYLVEHEGFRLLMDLGNGAFGALRRYVEPNEIDAVIVSHLHADHCIDFTSYVVSLRYGPKPPAARIPVTGPAGTRGRIEAAYDPVSRKLGLHELFNFGTPVAGEIGPFQVSYAEMNHPIQAYAIRLSAGDRTLVYSGDSGECDELVKLADGADTFLCEASFGPDEPYVPDLHLTGRQAGEHGERAGVGRMIITHVPPWNSREIATGEAAAAFGGPVDTAEPGLIFEI